MRKRKKLLLLLITALPLLAALLLLFMLFDEPPSAESGRELLANGNFSRLEENGLPEAWYTDAYHFGAAYTDFEVAEHAGPNQQHALHITNHELNDARFAQTVPVEPDSVYCLSGLIKTQAAGGHGANLSVEDVYTFSNHLYDTEGEWQAVSLYGRTGKSQRDLTVFARLGGYSGESQGEAWFADLSLKKAADVPPGVVIADFAPAGRQQDADASTAPVFDLRHGLLLFFLLLYGLLLAGFLHQRSILGLLALTAVATVVSVFAVWMAQTGSIEAVKAYTTPLPWVKYVFFGMSLLATLAAIWLVRDLSRRGEVPRIAVNHGTPHLADERQNARRLHRTDWKDWLILSAITAAYAALAFTNLGSTTSPQTSYTFDQGTEYVVFDLGENRDDFRMLYMGGIHDRDSDFTIQVSADGENWGDAISCDMKIGSLYQWLYVKGYGASDPRALSGRYVCLTAGRSGLNLLETLFRDAQGQVLPVTVKSSLGRDASALIDEQDTLAGEPSWFNSMYFDEIYHARTGYEHLHGLQPYEISHPPLGKVFISWCIAWLGMTPFGWRFAGAACGVLMLPGMYLLGKLLFSRRRYAVLSCLLLALDTLHFTQTRIATIDSFVVLFIIWSVYFMLRWFYSDFFGQRLWRTMAPLALSGLCMGLAVASKWPGCYAGVGLAVVFFWGIARRWKAVREARGLPEEHRDDIAHTAACQGGKRLLITVASCLIFFVLVPLAVYCCSYIPYLAPSGGISLQGILDAAEYMLGYHSQPGFGMDHRYYSPWYRWPLSEKPMFYAMHSYTPDGYTYAIFAFGNYAVWWVGLLALLAVIYAYCRHQAYPVLCRGYKQGVSLMAPRGERDERPALLLICFAAQFLPWLLVPRSTFIYHYFPSLPFVILCIAYVFERCHEGYQAMSVAKCDDLEAMAKAGKRADRRALAVLTVYLLLVAAMFAAFFPPASGVLVRREWMDAINWFHQFYY